MTGGIVVNLYDNDSHFPSLALEVRDGRSGERVIVRVPKGYCVEFGDTIWWKGKTVFWTPIGNHGNEKERPVPMLGRTLAVAKP